MKTIIGTLSLIILFGLTACSNDKPEVVKKEVIVVKEAPEKNTTIIVDKNGVKVATKKVEVIVNPEKKKQ